MSYQDVSRGKLQNAATATGNGTALDVDGFGTAVLQVTGTFVGTITFEGTVDDSTWVTISVLNMNGAQQQTATGAGAYFVPTGGMRRIRARISAYTSGSVTVDGAAIRDALAVMQAVPGLNNPRDIAAVSATTTAARLLTVAQGDVVSRAGVYIVPTNGTVYLGGSAVTSSTGFPVDSGEKFYVEWVLGSNWYVITASGTVDVRVVPIDR